MIKIIFAYNPNDIMSHVIKNRIDILNFKSKELDTEYHEINVHEEPQIIDDLDLEYNQTLIFINAETNKELYRIDRPFEYNSLILGLMVSKNLLKKQQKEGVL